VIFGFIDGVTQVLEFGIPVEIAKYSDKPSTPFDFHEFF
jgi:hypothetical protein